MREKEFNEENVNAIFKEIKTYDEMIAFKNDFFNITKFAPYIVPKKNYVDRYVGNMEKIDDSHIVFYVFNNTTRPFVVKRKSSIKRFVNNYKVVVQ